MRGVKALVLALILALGGAACGDDDGTEDTESPVLTDDAGDTNEDAGTTDDDTGDTGCTGGTGGGTGDDSPAPQGSPDPDATASGPDTGGGAIYDETPSVEP